jgi:hypothetical protein
MRSLFTEHLVLSSFLSSQEVLWFLILLSFLSLLVSNFLLLFRSLLVELHKFGKIKLGLLEELELSNQDVLERENLAALLGDLLSNVLLNAIRKDLYNYLFEKSALTISWSALSR